MYMCHWAELRARRDEVYRTDAHLQWHYMMHKLAQQSALLLCTLCLHIVNTEKNKTRQHWACQYVLNTLTY